MRIALENEIFKAVLEKKNGMALANAEAFKIQKVAESL